MRSEAAKLGLESLIGSAVVGLVLLGILLAFPAASACNSGNPSPEAAARAWGTKMGITFDAVSCAGTDSDGDGYVSCDARVHGDKLEVLSLQCASSYSWTTEGCKQTIGKAGRQ